MVDDEAPVITCPDDFAVASLSVSGGYPNYDMRNDVTVTDNCRSASVSFAPGAPTDLVLGDNFITATATDDAGNSAQCSYTITVLAVGACCTGTAGCSLMPRERCAQVGGSFNGIRSTCEAYTCGACCGGTQPGGATCRDDIARSECPDSATHLSNRRCLTDCGGCCHQGECFTTVRSQCSPSSFQAGDHACRTRCGSCCGGVTCIDNRFEPKCDGNTQFVPDTCENSCGN